MRKSRPEQQSCENGGGEQRRDATTQRGSAGGVLPVGIGGRELLRNVQRDRFARLWRRGDGGSFVLWLPGFEGAISNQATTPRFRGIGCLADCRGLQFLATALPQARKQLLRLFGGRC